jgi:hypothetical protein
MDCDDLPDRGPETAEAWDAHDARRRNDSFAPPETACECWCLHCRRVFSSDKIWFQKIRGATDGLTGFWMCPTPNCDGAGFTFDIFPTDAAHPANKGWVEFDDSDEMIPWSDDDGDDIDLNDEDDDDEVFAFDAFGDGEDEFGAETEWDPDEPQYAALDDLWQDDEDMEGEEWKYGLQPGERPGDDLPIPGYDSPKWENEEAGYDQPDRRPRELDWSDREKHLGEDDIPF